MGPARNPDTQLSCLGLPHPLSATLQSRLPPLIDPYLPFSNRQVLKIFAEEVTLFFSPSMLQLPFDLFDSRADLGE